MTIASLAGGMDVKHLLSFKLRSGRVGFVGDTSIGEGVSQRVLVRQVGSFLLVHENRV